MPRTTFTPKVDGFVSANGRPGLRAEHRLVSWLTVDLRGVHAFEVDGFTLAHLIDANSDEIVTVDPYEWDFSYDEPETLDPSRGYFLQNEEGAVVSVLACIKGWWYFPANGTMFAADDEEVFDKIREHGLSFYEGTQS